MIERPAYLGRFVFITRSMLSPELAAELAALGAPVIAKPFELDEIVRAIDAALTPR